MARNRLTHGTSSAPSSCFVCGTDNDRGLQLELFHDDDREVVLTEFTLHGAFSGPPHVVHGGLALAVLDELQSWAVVALAGKDAAVVRTRVEFRESVDVGQPYTAEGEVVSVTDDAVETVGRILDADGGVRVEALSSYYVHPPAAEGE